MIIMLPPCFVNGLCTDKRKTAAYVSLSGIWLRGLLQKYAVRVTMQRSRLFL